MKFCSRCGVIGRIDNLQRQHLPYCQPELAKGERGFLKVGELPEENEVDFRMLLGLMGAAEKQTKPQDQEREGSNEGEKLSPKSYVPYQRCPLRRATLEYA